MKALRRIPFADEEFPILSAAIELGNWLIGLKTLKESQRQAILKAQCHLTNRTFPAAGESYAFGFDAERSGLSRSWTVALEPDYLEIFSGYHPDPPYNEQDREYLREHPGELFGPAFWHKVAQEDWFMWYADANKPRVRAYDVSRWVEDVSNPDKYRFEGFSIEPDVEDPEDKGDPYINKLYRQVKVWTDENRVIHVEYPPELQAMFDAAEREEQSRKRRTDNS